MTRCRKCNELIGDSAPRCPYCKTEISANDRTKGIWKDEQIYQSSVAKAMEEYKRRVKLEMIVGAIVLLIGLIGGIVIISFDLNYAICSLAIIIAIFIIYVICVLKLRIGLCPYCESYLGRGRLLRTHCKRCGGRLQE